MKYDYDQLNNDVKKYVLFQTPIYEYKIFEHNSEIIIPKEIREMGEFNAIKAKNMIKKYKDFKLAKVKDVTKKIDLSNSPNEICEETELYDSKNNIWVWNSLNCY